MELDRGPSPSGRLPQRAWLRHSSLIPLVLVVLFCIAWALVGVRHFDLSMAQLHEDDGPIFYALAFKDPALFEGVYQVGAPITLRLPLKVMTSAIVWIPALLWKYLDLSPYSITWIITLLQISLFGLSVYIFSWTVTRKPVVSMVAVVFAYVAGVWGWAPANFGAGRAGLLVPYAAHLAMSLILLAFAFTLRNRVSWALLLLVVAGLVHPSLVMYAVAILGIYWLWTGVVDRDLRSLIYRLAGLGVVTLITLAPSMSVSMLVPTETLPKAEILAGMRQNRHFWAWTNPNRWPLSLVTTLDWMVLAGLSWRWRAKMAKGTGRLWLAALAAACVIGTSHLLGAWLGIPTLLTLAGLRSFMWLSLISVPLVVYYWLAHIRSRCWLAAGLSVVCLALPLLRGEYILIEPLIFGLLLVDISQGHLGPFQVRVPSWLVRVAWGLALLILIGWLLSFFIFLPLSRESGTGVANSFSKLVWWVKADLPPLRGRIAFLMTILGLTLAFWVVRRLADSRSGGVAKKDLSGAELGILALAGVYAVIAMGGAWQESRERAASIAHVLDAQLWAQANTSASSLFVVQSDGWQTMSMRRKLSPFTRESYAYAAPRQAKEHRDRLLDFYGITEQEGQALRGQGILQMERDLFHNFDEEDFLRFASEFGATHLVLNTRGDPYQLGLPVAYYNQGKVVYELRPLSLDECADQLVTLGTTSDFCLLGLVEANRLDMHRVYRLPLEWQGPDRIKIEDLEKTAAPLMRLGAKGGFLLDHNLFDGEHQLRISPATGTLPEDGGEVLVGLRSRSGSTYGETDASVGSAETVVLSVWARQAGDGSRANLVIKDKTKSWQKNEAGMQGTGWQHHIITRQIRLGAEEVIVGINWQALDDDDWLEITNLEIFVVPQEAD